MPRKRKNNKLSSETESKSCNASRNLILRNLQEAFASSLEPDVVASIFAECDDNMDATMEALFMLTGDRSRHEEQFLPHGEMVQLKATQLMPTTARRNFSDFHELAIPFREDSSFDCDFENDSADVTEKINIDTITHSGNHCNLKTIQPTSVFYNTDDDMDQDQNQCLATVLGNKNNFSEENNDESKVGVSEVNSKINDGNISVCKNYREETVSALNKILDASYNEQAQGSESVYSDEAYDVSKAKTSATVGAVNLNYDDENVKSANEVKNSLFNPVCSDNDTEKINDSEFSNYSFMSSCNNNIPFTQHLIPRSESPYFFVPSFFLPGIQSNVPRFNSCGKHSFITPLYSSKLNTHSPMAADVKKRTSKSSIEASINKNNSMFTNCDKKFQTKIESILNKIKKNELVLIILRGLPGSGKSTLASQLKHHGLIFNTDEYFMHNGEYIFDPNKLSESHAWNKTRAKTAMANKCTPIIIDNTNVEMWEMKPYVKFGIQYQYHIEILEPNTSWKFSPKELFKRNKHNILKSKIIKMKERYQYDVTIDKILCSKEPVSKKTLSLDKHNNDDLLESTDKIKNINELCLQSPQTYSSHNIEIKNNNETNNFGDFYNEPKNNSNINYLTTSDILKVNNNAQFTFSNTSETPIHGNHDKNFKCKENFELTKEIDDKEFGKNALLKQKTNLSYDGDSLIASSGTSLAKISSHDTWTEVDDDTFDWNDVSNETSKNLWLTEEKIVTFSPKPRRKDDFDLASDKIPHVQYSVDNGPVSPKKHKHLEQKTLKMKNKIAANFDLQMDINPILPMSSVSECEHNTMSSDELEISLPLPEEMEELAKSLEAMMLAKAQEIYLSDENEIDESEDFLNSGKETKDYEGKKLKKISHNHLPHTPHNHFLFLKDCFPSLTDEMIQTVLDRCNNDIDQATNILINSATNQNEPTSGSSQSSEIFSDPGNKHKHCRQEDIGSIGNKIDCKYLISDSAENNSVSPTNDSYINCNDSGEQISQDKKICLHLDAVFAKQLEELFGPIQCCSENLKYVVHLEKDVAKRIHENWMHTQQKGISDVAEQKMLNELVNNMNLSENASSNRIAAEESTKKQKLESYRCQSGISSVDDTVENFNSADSFSDIEDLEFALQIYKNDMMKQLEQRWSQADLASKLKKQKLHELFPRIDQTTLDELLYANNFNLNDTVELIKTSVGDLDEIYAAEDEILEAVKKESLKKVKVSARKDPDMYSFPSISSDDDINAEKLRSQANQYYQLRQMYFNKAKEAFSKGMKPTALFYSDQARIYSEKMWDANQNASVKILMHFNRGINDNTIDLHLLYVKEALKVLEQFLEQKRIEFQQNKCKSMVLDIITGKGTHSVHRIPRIKKNVINYLERNKYKYTEKNPGLIQVFL